MPATAATELCQAARNWIHISHLMPGTQVLGAINTAFQEAYSRKPEAEAALGLQPRHSDWGGGALITQPNACPRYQDLEFKHCHCHWRKTSIIWYMAIITEVLTDPNLFSQFMHFKHSGNQMIQGGSTPKLNDSKNNFAYLLI